MMFLIINFYHYSFIITQIDKRTVEDQIPALRWQQCAIQKHACRQQADFCVRIKLLSNGTIGDGGTVAATYMRQLMG